jgi:hypothetical protein
MNLPDAVLIALILSVTVIVYICCWGLTKLGRIED